MSVSSIPIVAEGGPLGGIRVHVAKDKSDVMLVNPTDHTKVCRYRVIRDVGSDRLVYDRDVVRIVTSFESKHEASIPSQKREWRTPAVRSYGTFDTTTLGCIKALGTTDGLLLEALAITCTAS